VTDVAAWTDTLIHNRKILAELLQVFGSDIEGLRTALETGDQRSVRRWLEAGSDWRRRAGE
jgi:prephenate dehydrogenase